MLLVYHTKRHVHIFLHFYTKKTAGEKYLIDGLTF